MRRRIERVEMSADDIRCAIGLWMQQRHPEIEDRRYDVDVLFRRGSGSGERKDSVDIRFVLMAR